MSSAYYRPSRATRWETRRVGKRRGEFTVTAAERISRRIGMDPLMVQVALNTLLDAWIQDLCTERVFVIPGVGRIRWVVVQAKPFIAPDFSCALRKLQFKGGLRSPKPFPRFFFSNLFVDPEQKKVQKTKKRRLNRLARLGPEGYHRYTQERMKRLEQAIQAYQYPPDHPLCRLLGSLRDNLRERDFDDDDQSDAIL